MFAPTMFCSVDAVIAEQRVGSNESIVYNVGMTKKSRPTESEVCAETSVIIGSRIQAGQRRRYDVKAVKRW